MVRVRFCFNFVAVKRKHTNNFSLLTQPVSYVQQAFQLMRK